MKTQSQNQVAVYQERGKQQADRQTLQYKNCSIKRVLSVNGVDRVPEEF